MKYNDEMSILTDNHFFITELLTKIEHHTATYSLANNSLRMSKPMEVSTLEPVGSASRKMDLIAAKQQLALELLLRHVISPVPRTFSPPTDLCGDDG